MVVRRIKWVNNSCKSVWNNSWFLLSAIKVLAISYTITEITVWLHCLERHSSFLRPFDSTIQIPYPVVYGPCLPSSHLVLIPQLILISNSGCLQVPRQATLSPTSESLCLSVCPPEVSSHIWLLISGCQRKNGFSTERLSWPILGNQGPTLPCFVFYHKSLFVFF